MTLGGSSHVLQSWLRVVLKTSSKVSKCCLQPLQSDGGMWEESSVKLFSQELNAVIGAFSFNSSERRGLSMTVGECL
jgi:hypothetical protein